jgi:UDP-glucose 4-epimerase
MTSVLVTGANGFVGRHLCGRLQELGFDVTAAIRCGVVDEVLPYRHVVVADLFDKRKLDAALRDIDAVVHCAALAHVLGDVSSQESVYMRVNAVATKILAESAAHSGVEKFVYLSSLKVFGDMSTGRPIEENDPPRAVGVYARSKLAGEAHLRQVSLGSDMRAVILRPPLVYGARVRANFLRLMSWIDRGIALPFACVENKRSIVSVWNLCDLVGHVLRPDVPVGDAPLLVSDGVDISTPELLLEVSHAMHRPNRTFRFPVGALRALGKVLGKSAEMSSLVDSFAANIVGTCQRLNWQPPMSTREGIGRTVDWYLSVHGCKK